MNVDIQSDLSTLEYKNGEQIDDFIAELSGFSKKLISMEKLSPIQDFY